MHEQRTSKFIKRGRTLHNIHCPRAIGKGLYKLTVVNLYNPFYDALNTMEVNGFYPDIVEFELMQEDIKSIEEVSVIATNLSWKYVVSVLYFDKCFYEDEVQQNPCYRYINSVVNESTYHMCYSKDIVFRDSHKYDWAYYLSDKVVKSENKDIVIAYTQEQVLRAFLCWWCNKVIGYSIVSCKEMSVADMIIMMPNEIDLSAIHQFNSMSMSLCNRLGYTVFPIDTTEEQRCKN